MDRTLNRWLLPFVLAWLTYLCARWAENQLSDAFRTDSAAFLKEGNYKAYLGNLPMIAEHAINRVFGPHHGSWMCVRRSIMFSACTIVLTFAVSVFFNPKDSIAFFGWLYSLKYHGIIVALLFWIIACALPDYLMLGKTRFVIWVLAKAQVRSSRMALTLLADFFVANWLFMTAFVGAQVVLGLTAVFIMGKQPADATIITMIGAGAVLFIIAFLAQLLLFAGTGILYTNIPLGNLFWSCMIPSIWLWLYILSSLLTRWLVTIYPMLARLSYVLDVDKHPLRSVGIVASFLVFIISLISITLYSLTLVLMSK